jgi:biotin carboxyl carrier protein
LTIQEVLVNRKPHRVKVLEKNGNTFTLEVNGKTVNAKIKNTVQGKTAILEINDKHFQPSVERVQGNVLQVKIGGKPFEVQFQPKIPKESDTKHEPIATTAKKPTISLPIEKDAVAAPIAGRIVLLRANVGQKVERGECICILEAMKMQNEITAPKAGVVKEFRVSKGAIVNKGDVLAVIS